MFDIYDVISNAYVFFIFEQQIYFCPHIAEVCSKITFGDIAPPVIVCENIGENIRPQMYNVSETVRRRKVSAPKSISIEHDL